MTFRIGTSGWQYDHWREVFYPRSLPKRQWLDYYCQRFDTVELNNSFYRQPATKSWDAWRAAVPKGFAFAVKASRFISHFKRFRDPETSLERLFDGANRLGCHLGPVLYQARPDFERTLANVERIDAFLSLLPRSQQHVLEFRHRSWFGEDTQRQLRQHDVGFCSYDMPGVDCPLVATAGFAYMRFHGTEPRYGGDYDDALLRRWATRFRALAKDVETVWVYFNNDSHGYAVQNAARLRELLG